MKKIKKSRKASITALILCAIALTGCKKASTEEIVAKPNTSVVIENQAEKENKKNKIHYTIEDNYVSIKRDNYGDYEEVEEEMYAEINEALGENSIEAFFAQGLDNQVDFNRIDLSNIKSLWINDPKENFDYKPFYNTTYYQIDIRVCEETNMENTLNFIKNLKLKKGMLIIDFDENLDLNLQNSFLEVISNLEELNKLQICSNAAEKLDLRSLKPNELTLFFDTNKLIMDYNFNINEEVKCFVFAPSYPKDYEEVPILNSVTISSNNEDLYINAFFFKFRDEKFKASLSKDTKINIPKNSYLYLNGINIAELTDEDFEIFRNLPYVYISNQYDPKKYFEYDANEMTLEDAIKNYHDLLEKKGLKIR